MPDLRGAGWERGYRCHGLWHAGKRVGVVTLPPAFGRIHGPGRRPKRAEFGWAFDCPRAPSAMKASGRGIMTLRRAKREVERRWLAFLAFCEGK